MSLGNVSVRHQIALIKKKTKFSSSMRKFRLEQLQSHIYEEGLPIICEEISKYLVIFDFATAPV